MDSSPNMKQYVGLLELICSSSPIPTAEVLQDVSVLYATLGKDIQAASLLFFVEFLTFGDPHISLLFVSHLPAARYLSARQLLHFPPLD